MSCLAREQEEDMIFIIRIPEDRRQDRAVARFLDKTSLSAELLDLPVARVHDLKMPWNALHPRLHENADFKKSWNSNYPFENDGLRSIAQIPPLEYHTSTSSTSSSETSSTSSSSSSRDSPQLEKSMGAIPAEVFSAVINGNAINNSNNKPLGSKIACTDGSTYMLGSTAINLGYDVAICGRGGHVNKVNSFLAQLIDERYREDYTAARAVADKRKVLHEVYKHVKARGGRFLGEDGQEVPREKALRKIRAAIAGKKHRHFCSHASSHHKVKDVGDDFVGTDASSVPVVNPRKVTDGESVFAGVGLSEESSHDETEDDSTNRSCEQHDGMADTSEGHNETCFCHEVVEAEGKILYEPLDPEMNAAAAYDLELMTRWAQSNELMMMEEELPFTFPAQNNPLSRRGSSSSEHSLSLRNSALWRISGSLHSICSIDEAAMEPAPGSMYSSYSA